MGVINMKTKFNWTDVTKEDVVKAIDYFLKYKPKHPEPRNTFLMYDGMKLPAKHIRGMAYREHYGEEISKEDYTGGEETVHFFNRLGFTVEYKKNIIEPDDENSGEEDTADDSVDTSDSIDKNETIEKAESIKVAMYLQTYKYHNDYNEFNRIVSVMKKSDADIIVFPENCYIPHVNELNSSDITSVDDLNKINDICLALSDKLGKAVIVSSVDSYGTIFSVFANAKASENETEVELYIKHTMCDCSCLEFSNYPELAGMIFNPINYRGYLIGMTICYDCNHALFSRMYGMYGIDLIINSRRKCDT